MQEQIKTVAPPKNVTVFEAGPLDFQLSSDCLKLTGKTNSRSQPNDYIEKLKAIAALLLENVPDYETEHEIRSPSHRAEFSNIDRLRSCHLNSGRSLEQPLRLSGPPILDAHHLAEPPSLSYTSWEPISQHRQVEGHPLFLS